jgi:hypothetical protein
VGELKPKRIPHHATVTTITNVAASSKNKKAADNSGFRKKHKRLLTLGCLLCLCEHVLLLFNRFSHYFIKKLSLFF